MRTDLPKRRLRAEVRRALIVDAALREFAEHGYDGASMGRIGRAAGVARTVLYDHFSCKLSLFVALLEDKHADVLSHLHEVIAADAPTEELMRASLDTFFGFAENEPLAWRLLFPEHPPVNPEAAAEHRRIEANANRMLADMLAPHAWRAGIDPTLPIGEAIFALQRGALHGAVAWWRAHPDVTREQLVTAAMDLLWVGMSSLGRRGDRSSAGLTAVRGKERAPERRRR
jgi:AcrR family transcriptional regulator